MDSKKQPIRPTRVTEDNVEGLGLLGELRRTCGCLRTSEKLQRTLDAFPQPPPPSPSRTSTFMTSISAYCARAPVKLADLKSSTNSVMTNQGHPEPTGSGKFNLLRLTRFSGNETSWRVVNELVQLLQLSLMATALMLYYLIYCYMQLVYYTLRTALYFHNADGPMKITIGVVTVTSLVVGFNVMLRIQRVVGFF